MKLLPPLCPEPISARRGGAVQGAGLYRGGQGYTAAGAAIRGRGYTGQGGAIRGRSYTVAGRGYMGAELFGGGAMQGAGRVQENSLALIFVYVNVNAP